MNLEERTEIFEVTDELGTASIAPFELYARARSYLSRAGISEPELTQKCVALVVDAWQIGGPDPLESLVSTMEESAVAHFHGGNENMIPAIERESMTPRPFTYVGSELRSRLTRVLGKLKLLRTGEQRPATS